MKTLTHPNPLPTIRREFDRLIEDLLPSLGGDARLAAPPPIDFSETDEAFIARVDLPGMKRDEIHVDIEDRRLVISGERRRESEEKNENFHRVERAYGTFCRSMTIPSEVKEDEIEATFDEGVLSVRIPKSETARPRRIEVKANGH